MFKLTLYPLFKGFWYLILDQVFGHDMNPYSLCMKMYVILFTCRSFSFNSHQVFEKNKSQSNIFRRFASTQFTCWNDYCLPWMNFRGNCFLIISEKLQHLIMYGKLPTIIIFTPCKFNFALWTSVFCVEYKNHPYTLTC